MKFIWKFFIIAIIINVTRAKHQLDIFLEYRNINSDVSKALKAPSYVVMKRRAIGLFPSLPHKGKKGKKFDLKSPKETYSQATKPEHYKKMREPSIKDINYKDNDKMKAEVYTRRSLMLTKKYTVKPHDVYRKSVREKYNWNSNRKNINKPRISKKQTNVGKTIYETIKNESRFLSFKIFDMSLNDKNYNVSEKQNNKNSYVSPDSQKLIITLLFPKRNNIKYYKENPEQSVSKQINNFVSEIKVSFNVVNNSNKSFIEEIQNIKVPSNAFIKSTSKDEMDDVLEPENNFFDQDEFTNVRVNDISFLETEVTDNYEITTDSDIEYLVSRHKRNANIIEEEGIATTYSGIKVTNQDYPLYHDLTFKNIHT